MCPYELEGFGAVGLWYDVFTQVEDDEAVALLEGHRPPAPVFSES